MAVKSMFMAARKSVRDMMRGFHDMLANNNLPGIAALKDFILNNNGNTAASLPCPQLAEVVANGGGNGFKDLVYEIVAKYDTCDSIPNTTAGIIEKYNSICHSFVQQVESTIECATREYITLNAHLYDSTRDSTPHAGF